MQRYAVARNRMRDGASGHLVRLPRGKPTFLACKRRASLSALPARVSALTRNDKCTTVAHFLNMGREGLWSLRPPNRVSGFRAHGTPAGSFLIGNRSLQARPYEARTQRFLRNESVRPAMAIGGTATEAGSPFAPQRVQPSADEAVCFVKARMASVLEGAKPVFWHQAEIGNDAGCPL